MSKGYLTIFMGDQNDKKFEVRIPAELKADDPSALNWLNSTVVSKIVCGIEFTASSKDALENDTPISLVQPQAIVDAYNAGIKAGITAARLKLKELDAKT